MSAPTRHVRRGLAVLAGAAATLTLAVLLAPLVQGALVGFGVNRPFAKIFRYVTGVLFLGWGLAALRPWRDVPRDLYGLRGPRARPSLALLGIAVALVVLLAIALFDAAAGHLTWDRWGPQKFAVRWKVALARGVVVGLVEEIVFRGWLFHRLPGAWSPRARGGVVALAFAFLHAFRETDAPRDLPATAASGLAILDAWARNLLDGGDFLPSALGLFLLSLALTGAYLRFSTLWFGVGLHGLAVAYLPLHSAWTQRVVDRDWAGSKWLYDGVPGFVALAALTWALWPRGAGRAGEDATSAGTAPPSPAPGPE